MRIREVGTVSGKKAIQVVSKRHGKVTVHKHIGSYGTESERIGLVKRAQQYIQESIGQISLFDYANTPRPNSIKITESRPLFVYQLLSRIYKKIGLSSYPDEGPVAKRLKKWRGPVNKLREWIKLYKDGYIFINFHQFLVKI